MSEEMANASVRAAGEKDGMQAPSCETSNVATSISSAPDRPSLEQRAAEAREAGWDRTLSLTLSYQGASFSGFARQKEEHLKTVQGEVEQALSLLFRREVKTVCAGRTDAGVHARAQVVSFDVTEDELAGRELRRLKRSLNALTDEGISIASVDERPLGFSARFDALWREYHYHISTEEAPPVLIEPLVWHAGGGVLDVDAMRAGAACLVGEHDFKSFCLAASAVGKSTFRNVMELEIYPEELAGFPVTTVRIVGSAFLHSMVRTIVGTLMAVGRGRQDAAWVQQVLDARDRSAAGENAPASGLVFWRVGYPPACAPVSRLGEGQLGALAPSDATASDATTPLDAACGR